VSAVIVGVDPGLTKGSAVAVLDRVTGRLIAASIVKTGQWLDQPAALSDILDLPEISAGESLLVAELAQVYERTHQAEGKKPDPNDLIELAACAGAWCAAGQSFGIPAELVRPAVWKGGNTPKEIEAERTRAKCSPEEIVLVERAARGKRQLDVWDAIGIARWAWRKMA
jgi:hypothetical protein